MNHFPSLSLVFLISDKERAKPRGCSEGSRHNKSLAQGLALVVLRSRGDTPGSRLGPLVSIEVGQRFLAIRVHPGAFPPGLLCPLASLRIKHEPPAFLRPQAQHFISPVCSPLEAGARVGSGLQLESHKDSFLLPTLASMIRGGRLAKGTDWRLCA